MNSKAEGLTNFAAALSKGDENDDGLVSFDELQDAMGSGEISVDVVRTERAAGSPDRVLENIGHFQHGTEHVDGASETHASGELSAPIVAPSTVQSEDVMGNSAKRGGQSSFQKKRTATERVREIMRMFDSDNNGVLNAKEQGEMYQSILKALELERKKEMAARNYDAGAAIRDQIAHIRKQIAKLDIDNEQRRQVEQKKQFESGMAARDETMKQQMRDTMARTEASISTRISLWNQRTELETAMLNKELAAWPIPPPRYSKGLIEMRHAEMALASDQRYEEAKNVRATTQVREKNEMKQLMQEWECKRGRIRHDLEKEHIDSAMRLEEKVKDMRWRAKRDNQDFRHLEKLCRKNQTKDMGHMLVMEKLKVAGTAHNVALPPARKPRPETNASCRGTRLSNFYIGKRHLAIPSLSGVHDFKKGERVKPDNRHRRGMASTRVV